MDLMSTLKSRSRLPSYLLDLRGLLLVEEAFELLELNGAPSRFDELLEELDFAFSRDLLSPSSLSVLPDLPISISVIPPTLLRAASRVKNSRSLEDLLLFCKRADFFTSRSVVLGLASRDEDFLDAWAKFSVDKHACPNSFLLFPAWCDWWDFVLNKSSDKNVLSVSF